MERILYAALLIAGIAALVAFAIILWKGALMGWPQ